MVRAGRRPWRDPRANGRLRRLAVSPCDSFVGTPHARSPARRTAPLNASRNRAVARTGAAEAAAGAGPKPAAGGGPRPLGGSAAARAAAARSASSDRPTARNTIDTARTQPTPNSDTATALPAIESPATARTTIAGDGRWQDGSDQSPHANQHNPRDVRAGLVAAGCHLPDLPALLRRLQRRWGGGPEGHHVPARLPPGTRRRGDLAVADLHEPDGRLRLRRRRLPRRRPDLRHPRTTSTS